MPGLSNGVNPHREFKRARLYKTHPSSPTQTDESLALLDFLGPRQGGMEALPYVKIKGLERCGSF
jgi:hypothetical protein